MNEANAKACAAAIRVETADLRRKLAAAEARYDKMYGEWLSLMADYNKSVALADRLGEALRELMEDRDVPQMQEAYAALREWREARGGKRG